MVSSARHVGVLRVSIRAINNVSLRLVILNKLSPSRIIDWGGALSFMFLLLAFMIGCHSRFPFSKGIILEFVLIITRFQIFCRRAPLVTGSTPGLGCWVLCNLVNFMYWMDWAIVVCCRLRGPASPFCRAFFTFLPPFVTLFLSALLASLPPASFWLEDCGPVERP